MKNISRIFSLTTVGIIIGILMGVLIKMHFFSRPHTFAPTKRYPVLAFKPKAIAAAKKFTVLISNEGFGVGSRGSGVIIDSIHILTCAHVASGDNDEIWVYFFPGRINLRAKVVYASRSKDLAILELIDGHVSHAPSVVFETKFYEGEPITIIGNIEGAMKWFISYGIISGSTERDLLTDGLVLGGDSGGPWINEAGNIVALSDWGLANGKGAPLGINGGISSRVIKEFLHDWKSPSLFSLILEG